MVRIPDLRFPKAGLSGGKAFAGIDHIHGLVTFYFAGIPEIAAVAFEGLFVAGHQDLIGGLFLAALARFDAPGHPWLGLVQAERGFKVFASEGERSQPGCSAGELKNEAEKNSD